MTEEEVVEMINQRLANIESLIFDATPALISEAQEAKIHSPNIEIPQRLLDLVEKIHNNNNNNGGNTE